MSDGAAADRILFDITVSALWGGRRPSGIVRTERAYGLHFKRHATPPVRFCRYSRRRREFLAIENDQAEAILHGETAPAAPKRASLFGWRRRRPVLSPRAGDLLVSVGMPWDSYDFAHLGALKKRIGFRAVHLCHDLMPVRFPEFFADPALPARYEAYLRHILEHADAVPCVSRATATDLAAFAAERGMPAPDTPITAPGCDLTAIARKPAAGIDLAARGFVLAVGAIEYRKNPALLYNLWSTLARERGAALPALVLAGAPGHGAADVLARLAADPVLAGKVAILDRAEDEEIVWLYRHCAFTLFPSLFEGWGIPVSESLAHGKYCIASNAGALPEAGQGLIDHIDPLDFMAWKLAIIGLLDEPGRLAALERQIGSAYRPRSWDEAGHAFLAVALAATRTALRR